MATFEGSAVSETIDGTDDADTIRGNGGADTLNGLGGDDTVEGGSDKDTIDGGTGADFMSGGGGNDIYYVDTAGDVVRDIVQSGNDGGFDTIYSTVSYALGQATGEYVERLSARDLTGTIGMTLIGNDLDNEIWGDAGNNILDGGGGRDILHGEKGDDVFYIRGGDVTIEGPNEGYDTVFLMDPLFRTYSLGNNVERLIATYAPNVIELVGNYLANEIIGNDGNNSIYSSPYVDDALDVLIGGKGDDSYHFKSAINGQLPTALDLVIEHEGEGYDTVYTNFAYTLPDNVEALSGAISLVGNALDNRLVTTDQGRDVLDGKGGADEMAGGAGDDVYFVDNLGDLVLERVPGADDGGYDTVFVDGIDYTLPDNVERGAATYVNGLSAFNLTGNNLDNELSGNDGANWLDGKLGRDILTGYGGADTFAFTTKVDSDNADLFVGFEVGIDKIALDDAVFTQLTAGALSDSAFHIGREAADADDRILYEASTGNLFYDPDGTGPLASQYFASMHEGLSLAASDFVVI